MSLVLWNLSVSSCNCSTQSTKEWKLSSHLWQSRQSRSAEAELQIFGSPDRDEMRKWTYPYLEVLAEQVRKMNEIFRSPGRAEIQKAELQIFGSQGRVGAEADLYIFGSPSRDEMRKWTYPYLEVLAEQVRKMNEIFEVLAERKYGKWNFRSLAVKTERNCGSKASDL